VRAETRKGETEVKGVSLPWVWRSQYLKLALVAALGVLLLLAGTFFTGPKPAQEAGQTAASFAEQEKAMSRAVEQAVSAIRGVGKVQATVTLEMGPESIFARNVTRSRTSQTETTQGETRENVTENETSQPVTGRFGTTESPLVEKVAPVKVGGCLVVAEGAASSRVKLEIYRAVETLLNVPIYKIQVLPMK
jgi:stage III sporulation protein AG